MIGGVGCDIVDVSRMKRWVNDEKMLRYIFNEKEIIGTDSEKKYSEQKRCEHYAVRFAAKEAFAKALGTGMSGFSTKDVFITNDENGAPILHIENKAKDIFEKRIEKKIDDCKIFVSLSHEKSNAIAFVVIDKLSG